MFGGFFGGWGRGAHKLLYFTLTKYKIPAVSRTLIDPLTSAASVKMAQIDYNCNLLTLFNKKNLQVVKVSITVFLNLK